MGGPNPNRYPPSIRDHDELLKWSSDNRAWAFSVQCQGCTHHATLYPGKVRHRYIRRVGDLKARLYCSHCNCRNFQIKPQLMMLRD